MNRFLFLICSIFATQGFSASASESVDFNIGLLLADKIFVGRVAEINATTPDDAFSEYRVKAINDAEVRNFLLNNPNREPLFEVGNEQRVFFLWEQDIFGRLHEEILWAPVLGVHTGAEYTHSRLVELTAKALRTASLFDRVKMDCSRSVKKYLRQLDGSKQQEAIDGLFAIRKLSIGEFSCILNSARSKRPLRVFSFKPPYPSSEGSFHHGHSTRGDLVLALLPHLTKAAIYSRSVPFSKSARDRLINAWKYWGYISYELASQTEAKSDLKQ